MAKYGFIGTLLVLLVLASTGSTHETDETGQEVRYFGGSCSTLAPEQSRLVDDWFRSFDELTRRDTDLEAFYDDFIRLSTKTTFDAVTHALLTTALTDASGNSLGTS
jgi:hypothetical protein